LIFGSFYSKQSPAYKSTFVARSDLPE
jgi:hypothetical protein